MHILNKLFLFLSLLVMTACSENEIERGIPTVLKIGILPDENKDSLLERYTPLFEYISDELGVSYTLIIPDTYQELLNYFKSGKVDLAYFGGVTFLIANQDYGAVPLVLRDTDLRFSSYFLVSADEPSERIVDFKNKNLVFGSRLSTSGHLMPRHFLNNQEIVPEEFFTTVEYSGAHDKTAYWIRDGKADLGVANSKIIDGMLKDGRLKQEEVRILWETPPYADYVWSLQGDFDKETQTRIRDIFLSLSPDNAKHFEILSKIDAGGFMPAVLKDFHELKMIHSRVIPVSSNY